MSNKNVSSQVKPTSQVRQQDIYNRHLKRISDFTIASALLVILSPILMLTAILIRITSPGPIIFKQDRLGKNQKIFAAYKFRTMTDVSRITTQQVRLDNTCITKVGYYLRRFKLDELPQLFNIVHGEMSIIGPRPCLPETLETFNDDAFDRLLVRPGLTGLAQINGNTNLTWPERWSWDAFYVHNISLKLDAQILWRTVGIVLFGESQTIRKCCD
jgi:undecaprenyl phosphate N,N'-diacetylbacillosamine 1-phosphate transferase